MLNKRFLVGLLIAGLLLNLFCLYINDFSFEVRQVEHKPYIQTQQCESGIKYANSDECVVRRLK